MGSLSNLYISQSYISLIHLGSDNVASSTPTELQDGLGNGIGVSVSTNKNLYVSGNVYATNLTGSTINTGSLVTTSSFNAYTSSNDSKVNSLIAATASYAISSSVKTVTDNLQTQINGLATTSSVNSISTSVGLLQTFSGSEYKADSASFSSRILAVTGSSIDTSSFATTGSNTFTAVNTFQQGINIAGQTTFSDGVINNTFSLQNISGSLEFNKIATASKVDFKNLSLLVSGAITASGNISSSGNIYAANLTGSTIDTGSLVTTASFNAYTASQDFKNTTFATTSSLNDLSASIFSTDATQSSLINGKLDTSSFTTFSSSVDSRLDLLELSGSGFATTSSVNDLSASIFSTDATQSNNISSNSSSIGLLQTFSGSQYKNDSSSFDSRINSAGGNVSVQEEGTILGNATSFNFIGAGVTATLSAGTASVTIPGGGGSIDTGSLVTTASFNAYTSSQDFKNTTFATTGSNTFVGNQTISGSASIINFANGEIDALKLVPYISTSAFSGNRDTAVVARGAFYNGAFTQSAASPVNIIFENALQAGTSISATSIISGSNNIVTGLRTVATNAADIIANNSYISVFPSTRTPAYAPVQINNSNVNSQITVTNNSVGLSSSLALGSSAFGYGVASNVANSNILAPVTLNPNSSSVNLNGVLNAAALTINGNKVNPDYTSATGSGFSHNNTINLGTTTLFDRASGSFNAGGTTWLRNLYGGVVTATNPLSATSSAGLQNTIIFGSNLIVTGSDAPGINNGGSSFFGRYNINDGVVNNTSNVVFAVGGGTSGNTRTPLWIGTTQNVNITGSLIVANPSTTGFSVDANAVVSGSKFYAGNNSVGVEFVPSTGSITDSYTRYGKDSFQIYQYQGQAYAFGVICTADQLNAYTGSQFRWGTVNGTGAIQNYMNMISASYTGSIGAGSPIPGLDYLKDGQILQFNRGTTFDKNVYIQQGLYVSQSIGGVVPALTLNGTNGTGALIASGSVVISGSLNVNNTSSFTGPVIVDAGTTFSAYGHKQFNVGAFSSTITQSGSAAVSQSMVFNTTDISNGVSLNGGGTQMIVANAGTYNIQFSAQLLADTGADDVYIWLKKNGTNITNTAGRVTLANNDELMAAWNYVVEANDNDYFELCWQSTSGDAVLLFNTSTGNIPGIPSVIATVTQVR